VISDGCVGVLDPVGGVSGRVSSHHSHHSPSADGIIPLIFRDARLMLNAGCDQTDLFTKLLDYLERLDTRVQELEADALRSKRVVSQCAATSELLANELVAKTMWLEKVEGENERLHRVLDTYQLAHASMHSQEAGRVEQQLSSLSIQVASANRTAATALSLVSNAVSRGDGTSP
jgi:hypothetical protein